MNNAQKDVHFLLKKKAGYYPEVGRSAVVAIQNTPVEEQTHPYTGLFGVETHPYTGLFGVETHPYTGLFGAETHPYIGTTQRNLIANRTCEISHEITKTGMAL